MAKHVKKGDLNQIGCITYLLLHRVTILHNEVYPLYTETLSCYFGYQNSNTIQIIIIFNCLLERIILACSIV
jgi:hypothetical protein